MNLSEQIVFFPAPADVIGDAVGQKAADVLLATMPEIIRRGRLGEYLDAEGVEQETGLTRRQLRHLRATRQLGFYPRGRKILFKPAAVFAYIDAGRVAARPIRAII